VDASAGHLRAAALRKSSHPILIAARRAERGYFHAEGRRLKATLRSLLG
jgi:hypothetical protein